MNNQSVSALMNQDLILRAMSIARPSIEALLRVSQREGPNFVHIVVLSPFEREDYDDGIGLLHEETIGPAPSDVSTWKGRYVDIARSKAVIARRRQMDTSVVAAQSPALLESGDTHYEGGVYLAGISTGASGVESYIDEAAARMSASAINALIKQQLAVARIEKKAFL